jgi:hypothetical protein
MRARKQHSHVVGKVLKVQDVLENYESFCLTRKRSRLRWFRECFPIFLDFIDETNTYDPEKFKGFDYFNYLLANRRNMSERSAIRGALNTMKVDLETWRDIKANGMKKPLDMFVVNGEYILNRGYRRIFMAKKLGYENLACRVFKSKEYFDKLKSGIETKPAGFVDAAAMQQFQTELEKSTDKYWVHEYTKLYSRHLSTLNPNKILEVGVKYTPSLRLWAELFPEAELYGVDIEEFPEHRGFNIFYGSQDDKEFMSRVAKNGPFDLVIDDASHHPVKTVKTLSYLWGSVASGGWYVIEDLYRNYIHTGRAGETMTKLKSMIDDMNRTCDIKSMHFYYNICFIQKT